MINKYANIETALALAQEHHLLLCKSYDYIADMFLYSAMTREEFAREKARLESVKDPLSYIIKLEDYTTLQGGPEKMQISFEQVKAAREELGQFSQDQIDFVIQARIGITSAIQAEVKKEAPDYVQAATDARDEFLSRAKRKYLLSEDEFCRIQDSLDVLELYSVT